MSKQKYSMPDDDDDAVDDGDEMVDMQDSNGNEDPDHYEESDGE